MYAPKQINPDSTNYDLDRAGALWQFHTANYCIALFAEPEDSDPADSFCDERDIAFASSGDPAHWFCAVVAVYGPDGKRIGFDTLGGCSYRSFREFYSGHHDPDPKNRNCSIQVPSRKGSRKRVRKYTVCHYFPDMVRKALSEARTHELRRQFVAD